MIVGEDACHVLLPDEKAEDLCGEFVPICTALYAINQLRKIRAGEVSSIFDHLVCDANSAQSILLHFPRDSALASTFIQICQHRGPMVWFLEI